MRLFVTLFLVFSFSTCLLAQEDNASVEQEVVQDGGLITPEPIDETKIGDTPESVGNLAPPPKQEVVSDKFDTNDTKVSQETNSSEPQIELACEKPIMLSNVGNGLGTRVVGKMFYVNAKLVCDVPLPLDYNLEIWDMTSNTKLEGTRRGQGFMYRMNSGLYPGKNSLENDVQRGAVNVLKPYKNIAFKITIGNKSYFSNSFSVRPAQIELKNPTASSYVVGELHRFFTQDLGDNAQLTLVSKEENLTFASVGDIFEISYATPVQTTIVVADEAFSGVDKSEEQCKNAQSTNNTCENIDSLCSCDPQLELGLKFIPEGLKFVNARIVNAKDTPFSFYGDEDNNISLAFDVKVGESVKQDLIVMVKPKFNRKDLKMIPKDLFKKPVIIRKEDIDNPVVSFNFMFNFKRDFNKPLHPLEINASSFEVVAKTKSRALTLDPKDISVGSYGFIYGNLYPQDATTSADVAHVKIYTRGYGKKAEVVAVTGKQEPMNGFGKNWWIVDTQTNLLASDFKDPSSFVGITKSSQEDATILIATIRQNEGGKKRYEIDLSTRKYLFYNEYMDEPLTLFFINKKF